ncbi:sensor histidine kinase [Sphingomonas sp.]|jgi:two-component sensor histidine kinase|uniref:sensor histidine kinase n=1 Tax=Sphingomonas sp. TaxID=28214 RepID=UPI002DF40335|nr:histidine kinase [Sphingomonas sp.]HEV2568251.1 histidine kinase [Sphingomonas sp.]
MKPLGALLGNAALRPVLVIWGFGYLLVDIFVYLMGRMPLGVSSVASIPLFILGVTYTLLLEWTRQRLRDRPSWIRWGGLGAALMLATAVHSFFDLYYFKWLAIAVVPDWQRWAMDITPERIFTVGLLYLWTFCLALTLLWAAGVGGAAERAAARATLFKAEKQRAEAAALRLQLNPHFLFNTLNSISSLVTLDRKAEAETMIDQLAGFLRASLESDPMADVPLARELDTIEAYLGIEAARFGERLSIEVDVADAAMAAMVPNFILQPLVENAIKHGVAAQRGEATLRVSAVAEGEELVLSVVNRATTGDSPDPAGAGGHGRKGIGLMNIRQRLRISYGERASLDTRAVDDGFVATIRLPLQLSRIDRAAA